MKIVYELLFTGSGIYKQQQDTYTQLTGGESVYLTEDITLVCVSSTAGLSAWYYRNISTVVEERITEGTEVMNSKGFLTLSLQTTNRAGYYTCKTTEVTEDTSGTRTIEHSIIVSLPILTTTPTPIATTTKPTTTWELMTQQTTQTTTTTTPTPLPTITTTTTLNLVAYVIAGLLLFIILLVLAIVVCSVVLVRKVLKSKKTNNYKYSKKSLEETTPPVNTSDKKEYISLSDVHTGTKIQQTHNYVPMASVYPPHNEYIPLEVTTRPNYSEIPDSHFDSENDSKDRKYENLTSVISS